MATKKKTKSFQCIVHLHLWRVDNKKVDHRNNKDRLHPQNLLK